MELADVKLTNDGSVEDPNAPAWPGPEPHHGPGPGFKPYHEPRPSPEPGLGPVILTQVLTMTWIGGVQCPNRRLSSNPVRSGPVALGGLWIRSYQLWHWWPTVAPWGVLHSQGSYEHHELAHSPCPRAIGRFA